MAAGTLPLAPDMRPSVTRATRMPLVLENAQRRGQLMQFGHAIGAGSLEPDDDDHVAVELARLERVEHLVLVGKHARRCLDLSSAASGRS